MPAPALREVATSDYERHNNVTRKGSELPVRVDTSNMVQSMVEKGLTEVPAEFVLPPEHRISATPIKSIDNIPVIDMTEYFQHEDGEARVVAQIGRACEEWGFFQVINHGFPAALMQEAMQMCREFFALPMQEKELYCMKTSSGIGYGRRFAVKEGARVDWVDRLGFWSASAEHRMRQPLDVQRPTTFNETVSRYGDEILKLTHMLLTALSRHAGLASDYLVTQLGDVKEAGVRTGMNYYPPCPQPELVMGISSHADGSVLTIVQQDGTPGLQVLKNGQWVAIPAIPNAFVVNVGDQIQMISNERYKSVVHRVIGASNGRKSISNFFLPGWNSTISPSPHFCSPSNPPLYRPVQFSDYITEFMKVPLGDGRFVDTFKLDYP